MNSNRGDTLTTMGDVAYLPSELLPNARADLIRLGPNADGGYVVTPESVLRSDVLVSFGISNNWLFESNFLNMNMVPCSAYDDTTGPWLFFKVFLRRCLDFAMGRSSLQAIGRSFGAYSKYKEFFSGDVQHRKERIGLKSGGMTELSDILADIDVDKKVFLKIDIEGSEYEILDQIVENAGRLSGLAIEFHDVPEFLATILAFVRDFDLPVVHAHANNYQGVDRDGVPNVIELSFALDPTWTEEAANLPHPLDRPNDTQKPELPILHGPAQPVPA